MSRTPGRRGAGRRTGRWTGWRDPRLRAVAFQALFLAAVLALAGYVLDNTLANLEARGIGTGFGFLSETAGFGIIQTLIDYSETSSFGQTFVVGLLNTLLVSALGILLATLIGFLVGIARLSGNWLIARLAGTYIEIFRNIPLLLQIFFWYFAVLSALPRPRQSFSLGEAVFLNLRGLYLPRPLFEPGFDLVLTALGIAVVTAILVRRWARRQREPIGRDLPTGWIGLALVIGLPAIAFLFAGAPLGWERPALAGFNFRGGITVIPELMALLLALSIYTAAFVAEIVRAGILSVAKGQTEAAAALGLRRGQILRLVVIPQALRVIIPPLTSQYLNLLKNSSLATAIGYPDLVNVFAGTTLNQTGQAVEVIAMTMAVYLVISLAISLSMNWYNARIALTER
ncbi:amine acid ABC transporter, permease protein, 3-TM region, His/Glu/Gln/Arg/opine family [Thioflavicoccus mobilis 8321]|uniref:Amine acid ABC transporter, permease protein, 3-TM region, His/Glu/Gln/Arg/opine family n=1 Tax=Thioflavicoccus mobilis 8321 TaxID=765912 RepID=L0GY68_9GAMM|nr:amino acid ABC transporter permease [Thioflavicoccus mobilis]AGA90325.1 amine acid ABC transporter, permease protein, 3-TM region, His/Glu/Gln/Arg/opine family [Thioflavicoccus mobilis 8321]